MCSIIHIIKYYLEIKKKQITETCNDMDEISKIIQRRSTHYIIPFI